jgi:hypothetical protein
MGATTAVRGAATRTAPLNRSSPTKNFTASTERSYPGPRPPAWPSELLTPMSETALQARRHSCPAKCSVDAPRHGPRVFFKQSSAIAPAQARLCALSAMELSTRSQHPRASWANGTYGTVAIPVMARITPRTVYEQRGGAHDRAANTIRRQSGAKGRLHWATARWKAHSPHPSDRHVPMPSGYVARASSR